MRPNEVQIRHVLLSTSSCNDTINFCFILGLSPFGLPYTSHLAHLPGAFLMGQHPAFPVTSLFGGLGDGMLGHFPTSLAASTGMKGK